MSTFLSVTGYGILDVMENTGYEEPPDLMGVARRVASNNYVSSERSPKRGFACVAKFTPTAFATFQSIINVGGSYGVPVVVEVTSDVDGLTLGAALQMYVKVGRIQHKSRGAGAANKTVSILAPLAFREA